MIINIDEAPSLKEAIFAFYVLKSTHFPVLFLPVFVKMYGLGLNHSERKFIDLTKNLS